VIVRRISTESVPVALTITAVHIVIGCRSAFRSRDLPVGCVTFPLAA
jgi:hypothetical protein